MFASLKQSTRNRFAAFLEQRIPRRREVTLNQRRIFIFPSRQGAGFLLLMLLMLLVAINYQSNMAFALAFLLISVFIVSILHTYANLSGLTISAVHRSSTFVGDQAELLVTVSRYGERHYFDIFLAWPESELQSVSLLDNAQEQVALHLPMTRRGLFQPERLLVESFYPVGLLRCWTWLALDTNVIVYPKPLACKLPSSDGVSDDTGEGDLINVEGSDDFYQFMEYQPGDPLKHAHWKGFAKGQALMTKQYAAFRDQQLWLDYQAFNGDIEERLSKLCFWVLRLEKGIDDYGLRLPGRDFPPGHGQAHQQQLLNALAMFGTEDNLQQSAESSVR